MMLFRISGPAKADIASILRRSEQSYGEGARSRHRACLSAAMRRIAADPGGHLTIDCRDLAPGVRSFHIRHGRAQSREVPVAKPVHVIFYRVIDEKVVEIVRVLHERMLPSRHIGSQSD